MAKNMITWINPVSRGAPLPPYIKEPRGRGWPTKEGRAKGSPTPTGSRTPSFLVGVGEDRKSVV